ncbi:MAG: hypothetical protein ACRDNW_05940, partial [Trebonia sp.]
MTDMSSGQGGIARSRAFYDRVFGWPVYAEVPADADAATREKLAFLFGGVLYQVEPWTSLASCTVRSRTSG